MILHPRGYFNALRKDYGIRARRLVAIVDYRKRMGASRPGGLARRTRRFGLIVQRYRIDVVVVDADRGRPPEFNMAVREEHILSVSTVIA